MVFARRAFLIATAAGVTFARAAERAEIVCPLSAAPAVLIPGVSDAPATRLIGSKIYRGLLRWGADGSQQPDLANAIDVSADGLTYTIHLRSGVTWHDGGGFSAADVAFSIGRFHRALQPRLRLERVTSVATPDDLTAVVKLDAPDGGFLRLLDALCLPIVPQHVHDRSDWALDPRQTIPVGAGPFRFDDWLHLVRFDWYAGPKPALPAIRFPILPDPAARLAFIGGDRPVLLVGDAVELSEVPRLRSVPAVAVEAVPTPVAGAMAGLMLNLTRKPLDQLDVRLGLACAIDRRSILATAWSGMGRVATGPVVAGSLDRNDAAALPGYSLRAAAEHFGRAGLRPDDEGVRLRLTYLYPPGVPWQVLYLQLQASLEQVGVDLTAVPVPQAEWAQRVAAGDYELTGFATAQAGDPALDLAVYAAALPELASLLRGGGAGEREAQALLVAKMPVLWLVEPATPVIRSRRLHLPGGAFGSFAEASLD